MDIFRITRSLQNEIDELRFLLERTGMSDILEYRYDPATNGSNILVYTDESWDTGREMLLDYLDIAGIDYVDDEDSLSFGRFFFFNSFGRLATLYDLEALAIPGDNPEDTFEGPNLTMEEVAIILRNIA